MKCNFISAQTLLSHFTVQWKLVIHDVPATQLTARRLRTHSSKMASFTTSVISRANALALQGYKHCCHVMLHCPVEEKLFGFYAVKHAVLVSIYL